VPVPLVHSELQQTSASARPVSGNSTPPHHAPIYERARQALALKQSSPLLKPQQVDTRPTQQVVEKSESIVTKDPIPSAKSQSDLPALEEKKAVAKQEKAPSRRGRRGSAQKVTDVEVAEVKSIDTTDSPSPPRKRGRRRRSSVMVDVELLDLDQESTVTEEIGAGEENEEYDQDDEEATDDASPVRQSKGSKSRKRGRGVRSDSPDSSVEAKTSRVQRKRRKSTRSRRSSLK
jgi:hypothetical protein